MMLRTLGDTATLAFPFSGGDVSGAPVVDASSLPNFCDPMWTAINGGICTDAMGQYRTPSGAVVTGDQILAALKAPTSASAPTLPNPFASTSTSTFLLIVAAVFFFIMVARR